MGTNNQITGSEPEFSQLMPKDLYRVYLLITDTELMPLSTKLLTSLAVTMNTALFTIF